MRWALAPAAFIALVACTSGGGEGDNSGSVDDGDITEPPPPPPPPPPAIANLQFAQTYVDVPENAGNATLEVTRSGSTSGPVTVTYTTHEHAAQAGVDYVAVQGELRWEDGDGSSRYIQIPIIDNTRYEPYLRVVQANLENPGGDAALGGITQMAVNIIEDEPPIGLLILDQNPQPAENSGTLTVTVTRVDGSYGELSVRYTLQPGSAKPGVDYVDREATLTWPDGDTSPRSLDISLLDNERCEGDRTFGLLPIEVTDGAGAQGTYVRIVDDEGPPGEFTLHDASAPETAGVATVRVSRVNGSGCTASLAYSSWETTADGYARPGIDYQPVSGTLEWADGDGADKIIEISVMDNSVFGPHWRPVDFVFSNAIGARIVGAREASLKITDDESAGVTFTEAFPDLPSFEAPVFLTAAPGNADDLYVVEQGGVIRHFAKQADVAASEVFLDISDRVATGGELGLLGLAFDPAFASNGYFYVNYTAGPPLQTVISRFSAATAHVATPASEQVLLTYSQPYENHKGGWLAFGPDGKLHIASGDGGDHNTAQQLDSLLGKILRINPDGTIPADNPFASTAGARGEIWAYGFRNPWRASFDRGTGQLWVGDVGEHAREEIDIVRAGRNYGWEYCEGFACIGTPPAYEPPIFDYPHGVGYSVTGGYVYRGSAIPEAAGVYFYADFIGGGVWGLAYDGSAVLANTRVATVSYPSSFGEDLDGELYLLSYYGRVLRLVK